MGAQAQGLERRFEQIGLGFAQLDRMGLNRIARDRLPFLS
jgi:hypothetical protein